MLFRDEMANFGLGGGGDGADDQGRPQDRFAQWAGRDVRRHRQIPTCRPTTSIAEVPAHWFPLVPDNWRTWSRCGSGWSR